MSLDSRFDSEKGEDDAMLNMLVKPLIITLILETAAALIIGIRKADELLRLALINIITNLSINLFLIFWKLYHPVNTVLTVIIILELAVVVSEWLLIRKAIKSVKHPFLISLYLNVVSFAGGLFFI